MIFKYPKKFLLLLFFVENVFLFLRGELLESEYSLK